jgi:hypothetical protein
MSRSSHHARAQALSPVADDGARDEAVVSAVRWLRCAYRLGAVVDGLATVGMLFPRRLWTAGFRAPFDRSRPEFAYGMRAAAPLMAGWTVLLVWADRRPLERRDVVAMTALPVVAGLMAGDAAAVRAGHVRAKSILPTRVLQSALMALFAVSYARSLAATRGEPRSGPSRPNGPALLRLGTNRQVPLPELEPATGRTAPAI